jgi:anti-sigma regulatory factor (Ser/Thr protein kinase)
MRTDWLTVGLVEEIHRAVLRDVAVGAVVEQLKGASLPGLLEYQCLRWAFRDGSVPSLPPCVQASALGKALLATPCDLGLRQKGSTGRRLGRLDPQDVELHVVGREGDLAREEWDHFTTRFDASARSVGFNGEIAAGLQGALVEMAENVVIHAQAQTAALVGYQVSPGVALFCVVDVGIGILASLQSRRAYRRLKLHSEAIRMALQDGVTRLDPEEGGGGFGFRQVFRALAAHWGTLRFRSGEGCVTMQGTDCDANRGDVSHPPPLPGFQLTVCCRTASPRTSHNGIAL